MMLTIFMSLNSRQVLITAKQHTERKTSLTEGGRRELVSRETHFG